MLVARFYLRATDRNLIEHLIASPALANPTLCCLRSEIFGEITAAKTRFESKRCGALLPIAQIEQIHRMPDLTAAALADGPRDRFATNSRRWP